MVSLQRVPGVFSRGGEGGHGGVDGEGDGGVEVLVVYVQVEEGTQWVGEGVDRRRVNEGE